MRKQFIAWCMVVVLLLVTIAPAGAEDIGPLVPLEPPPTFETGELVIETPELWYVELTGPPRADGGHPHSIQHEQANFRAEAERAGLEYVERNAFDTLWNGLSIEIPPSDLAALSRIPGVKNLYPITTLSPPETQPVMDLRLATGLAMTGADIVQSELGLTGDGIRVGVIDSGIDYTHPDFGGHPDIEFPTDRVVTGFDFVGDHFDSSDPENNTPKPNPDPMDCDGHGTVVSGVIGAEAAEPSGVTGVAPGVTFGAYKVFGCEPTPIPSDIMLQALEMILVDEMDVVNLSVGVNSIWPQAPITRAFDRLVNQGVVVVAAVGNSGHLGLYTTAAPAVSQKAIGVASVENTLTAAPAFNLEPGGQQVPYLAMGFAPEPPTDGTSLEVVYVGRGCVDTLGDGHLADPAGKVALINRGDCSFDEKYSEAAKAGAVGVVIHNNIPGLFLGGGITAIDNVFGVSISLADGLHIRDLLDSSGTPVTLEWTDEHLVTSTPQGGLISPFSSYGLAPDLSLKPDISAPGGFIRTTSPVALGSYVTSHGTSLSTPHVAGAAALLLEAHPNTPSQAVRGILQNSAEPLPWWGNPDLGFLDHVHRQGAGMLNIAQAITATTKIEPAKLSLGASDAGPATRTLWIENNRSAAITFNLSHVPALSTDGDTFEPSVFTGFANVTFSSPSITVAPGATASVDVTITAHPALPEQSLYGGYIVFDAAGGAGNGEVHRVPYAGFKGDYQSIVVLEPREFDLPWLARRVEQDGELFLQNVQTHPKGATFNLVGLDDFPVIVVHLAHPTRRLRVEVFDADTGRAWHRAFELEYLSYHASNPTGIIAFTWDGMTTNGRRVNVVPDGDYIIKLSVQKALGDDDNPDHWETWTSPVLTLKRSGEASQLDNTHGHGQGQGQDRQHMLEQMLFIPALEAQDLE